MARSSLMLLLERVAGRTLPRSRPMRAVCAAVLLVGGTAAVARLLQDDEAGRSAADDASTAAAARAAADAAAAREAAEAAKKPSQPRIAVNAQFVRRLVRVLGIVVPGPFTRETAFLVVLSVLLVSRTMLSIAVADVTGRNAQYVVQRDWAALVRGMLTFGAIAVPASLVNSGLKYCAAMLALAFSRRLTKHINGSYVRDMNFYKATSLGGVADRIDNADQRVTADIMRFSHGLSALYTVIFKPVLDVGLFSYRLTNAVGAYAPLTIFAYYFGAGILKRFLMPSLGRLAARSSQLEGNYRTGHQRLIVNAEEISFYAGANKERSILHRLFMDMYRHQTYSAAVTAAIGVFDTFIVKYGASLVGYLVLAKPILDDMAAGRLGSGDASATADNTRSFVSNRALLVNLATATGQLVVLANRVLELAGVTSRVAELLEMVDRVVAHSNRPFELHAAERGGGCCCCERRRRRW